MSVMVAKKCICDPDARCHKTQKIIVSDIIRAPTNLHVRPRSHWSLWGPQGEIKLLLLFHLDNFGYLIPCSACDFCYMLKNVTLIRFLNSSYKLKT